MPDKHILILNHQQIQQKIDRIAYQVLEDNFDEEEIMIAGILPQGNKIAQRIKDILDELAPFKSTLVTIELDENAMKIDDAVIPLTPGMTLTAEIKTDSRRMIEYLLSPIARIASEALKER